MDTREAWGEDGHEDSESHGGHAHDERFGIPVRQRRTETHDAGQPETPLEHRAVTASGEAAEEEPRGPHTHAAAQRAGAREHDGRHERRPAGEKEGCVHAHEHGSDALGGQGREGEHDEDGRPGSTEPDEPGPTLGRGRESLPFNHEERRGRPGEP